MLDFTVSYTFSVRCLESRPRVNFVFHGYIYTLRRSLMSVVALHVGP